MKSPVFILIAILIIGCSTFFEENSLNEVYRKVEIVGYDENCGLCLAKPISENDSEQSAQSSNESLYRCLNLCKSDFKIGERLSVKMRHPKNDEEKACISLYAVPDCQTFYVVDYKYKCNMRKGKRMELAYNDCINDFRKEAYVCLDTILTDSRCPADAVCIWEGEAIARFKIKTKNQEIAYFDLKERSDTTILGYHFSFKKLLPYPTVDKTAELTDYKAIVLIR